MRPLLIFGSLIVLMALVSLFFLTEMTTGFAERIWHNWLFVQEAKIQGDLPWIRPGQKATFYLKYNYTWNNGSYKISEWGAGPRDTANVSQTVYSIFEFLAQTEAAQSWVAVGETRVAPYRFFIVSLKPAVVLMQPVPELPKLWEEQSRLQKAKPDSTTPGPWDHWSESIPEPKIYPIWLQNPVQYGTHLPAGPSWEWFSPDLNQAPVSLPMETTGPAPIRWQGGELVFVPDGKGWQVERR